MLQMEPTGFPARVDVVGTEREEPRMTPRRWSEEVEDGVACTQKIARSKIRPLVT